MGTRNIHMTQDISDIFIIGGGINGCGIARDFVGRGLSVILAEMGDIGGATSSASTKMFHGGLRYLEYFEFSLVKKALKEREILLSAMPHISWPMRFVIPYHQDMRFDNTTPTSKLLGILFPWLRGQRPAWIIRIGLFLYDHLGGRNILPVSNSIDLTTDIAGEALQHRFTRGFEYSDCWIQDTRLVCLNARDAKQRGADIMVRTVVTHVQRCDGIWHITLCDLDKNTTLKKYAKCIINASGPWVNDVLHTKIHDHTTQHSNAHHAPLQKIRLVRGSHIVVKKFYDHDKAYFLQGTDGRIMFTIPYEQEYTLIGTTDVDHHASMDTVACSTEEMSYMCDFVNQYFKAQITPEDVVWSFAGVRPLHDNGADTASATTRDYTFTVDTQDKTAPILHIFGGKITTYRKLAESAFTHIADFFPHAGGHWTAGQPLAGGDFAIDEVDSLIAKAITDFGFLTPWMATRLVRCYGTDIWQFLHADADKNGMDFGMGLSEAEINWLIKTEFVRTADDVLWRRTRMGLHLTTSQIQTVHTWFNNKNHA